MNPGEGIGAAPLRREDVRFITGRGRFVADIDAEGQPFTHNPLGAKGAGTSVARATRRRRQGP